MDSGANTTTSSAANYLIEGLLEAGIEYVFSNMGTDHAPIIEALAGRIPNVLLRMAQNSIEKRRNMAFSFGK